MTNRSQRTLANNVLSSFQPIVCGVPQGSTLGPLLFIVFINDIINVVSHSTIHLYADDTVLYWSSRDPYTARNLVQVDLDNIVQWCTNNKLTIVVPTCFLLFSFTFLFEDFYYSVKEYRKISVWCSSGELHLCRNQALS